MTWGLPRVPPSLQFRDRRVKLISRRDGDGAFIICASSDQVLALQIYIQKARPTCYHAFLVHLAGWKPPGTIRSRTP